jgi:hypothetical protein
VRRGSEDEEVEQPKTRRCDVSRCVDPASVFWFRRLAASHSHSFIKLGNNLPASVSGVGQGTDCGVDNGRTTRADGGKLAENMDVSAQLLRLSQEFGLRLASSPYLQSSGHSTPGINSDLVSQQIGAEGRDEHAHLEAIPVVSTTGV